MHLFLIRAYEIYRLVYLIFVVSIVISMGFSYRLLILFLYIILYYITISIAWVAEYELGSLIIDCYQSKPTSIYPICLLQNAVHKKLQTKFHFCRLKLPMRHIKPTISQVATKRNSHYRVHQTQSTGHNYSTVSTAHPSPFSNQTRVTSFPADLMAKQRAHPAQRQTNGVWLSFNRSH